MKLLNLTAALFLGGVLQAQNPLPAESASWLYSFRHATSG